MIFRTHSLKALIFSLFLTGCAVHQAQFSVPDKVSFKGTTFEKVTHNQIDQMQQMLYLPEQSVKNPDDWNQGILLFLDKNSDAQTLQQRVELRQQSFAKQPSTKADIKIIGDELRSEVIYPPTERFPNVMLEVSRGRDSQCGYGQIQFSDKRSVSAKKLQNLTAYQSALTELAAQFSQLAWQIECK
ncbi:ABC transporter ATPase [Pasteurellaceae bacterium LFhippo2]|nr:ABC transporter ATPase [Pasteurellaceae bacterium LFhippo2]